MIEHRNMAVGRSILYGALAGIGLALVFCAGFFVRDMMDMPSVFAASTSSSDEAGYPLLDEVQDLLDAHYLRHQPDYTMRQYAAIRGMLGALGDRNTFFIEPPVAQSESDVLAGTYGGIGVTLQRNAAGEFILFPFEESPARAAGIEDGDVLIAVNGEALDLTTHPDVVDQMLRGEVKEDNGVEVTLLKANGEEIALFILFDVINVPSVQWRVLEQDNRLGYIQILRFTSRTPDEILEAVEDLESNSIDGVILDLRDNFGGLLQEAVDVAGVFLDGGSVLYQITQDNEITFTASDGGVLLDMPMAVLVNQGTASASELLAGALQDRERAILIGQTTFGKGTIQQIYQLSDQSSIHITSAEWLTPARNRLDGVGLEPNIAMIPDENGRDVELEEAIRYLDNMLTLNDSE
jgi:carboxyl-terminal processing protease